MPKGCTWFVVVDAAHARVYALGRPGGALTDIGAFDNAFLHAHARDVGSDRPGRSLDSSGSARHAEEPRCDPHRREKALFARFVADWLESRHRQFAALILIAPPQVLGELRQAIGPESARRLVRDIDKDLTKMPAAELRRRLKALVPAGAVGLPTP